MNDRVIPFALPDIGEAEIAAVVGVLGSRWLTTGPQCRAFEQEFAAAVGASHAVALNSCTAAMHLSLEALDVTVGDLVFMSPYTFAATGEVVRYLGARPVFVDIDPVTLNIDTALLREAVAAHTDGHLGRPRVIMPVHVAGMPCDMDAIWSIAAQYDLGVVEDAAHAFPSAYNGRPVGSMPSHIRGTACFSFYATKTITTGEGGMLVTDSAAVADRARSMSLHGLSKQAWSRYSEGGSWVYDIVAPGFKYNLGDIAAALGRVQLSRANEMAARRREIAEAYNRAFATAGQLQTPADPAGADHSWHLYVLRLDDANRRDRFVESLGRAGLGVSVHFIPLHLHSYYVDEYGYRPEDFPHATAQFRRAVSLPIYSAMDDADVAHVIAAVASGLND